MLDKLTGLQTRKAMLKRLEEELNRLKRYQRNFSIIIIDIDNCKKINTTFGRDFGDRVLVRFSNWITKNIRNVDLFFRYGKDAFVVLLPETQQVEVVTAATRLRSGIESTNFGLSKQPCHLTVSVGCLATDKTSVKSIEELLHLANLALQTAKKNGGNQVILV